MEIRFMTVDDVDAVMEIEEQSFTVPWSREAFISEMEENHLSMYIVIEDEGQIAGYCGVWIVVDEAHITNVAVLPSHRGKGYGELLMRKIMEMAIESGARVMTLEARVSNVPAQSLYRKLGFQDGGIRKRYYSDNQEDALVMWVNL
ncbi:ribosomal-protein-alanine N-acetyltransferase [Rossellomorea marisflavi]|uniref:[Ribosomal protein bS18]-alanine N-acetyltransferase n=2 Tax=Bacillaceae TaxID=186817 RepID=A0A0J5VBU6_9BACI|nr:ribosomal protein S18-alanine N-acetyltransferase [Rossellomorea marisflavi]KMK90772.1 alanine acetyltransferase [Rossellomorea marisflavi]KML32325.1 alanine acetyltransferase [Rossellomorea marisflavi]KZE48542.1 ribosomal-protein-alanine acetyltransferase [Rossellomorea marisflavi]QHA34660.1 ribosomal-protein-alanine N-acetyltransferase [Rossellomorea marisflavi]